MAKRGRIVCSTPLAEACKRLQRLNRAEKARTSWIHGSKGSWRGRRARSSWHVVERAGRRRHTPWGGGKGVQTVGRLAASASECLPPSRSRDRGGSPPCYRRRPIITLCLTLGRSRLLLAQRVSRRDQNHLHTLFT